MSFRPLLLAAPAALVAGLMTDEANKKGPESTRREFLTATTALAGAALTAGLPGPAAAERKRNPKRGGTVRFGTRDDSVGLDTHRNFIYYVSQPLAGTTGGLLDFDAGMETAPLIAAFPELAICYTVLAFNLFGDGLRDILDPRLAER